MTETAEIVRTVVCPLETSERKNDKLQRGVSDFRRAAAVTATMLPSFQPHTWEQNNTQIYRTVKQELDEWDIKDKVLQNAVHRVTRNFKSTRELGHDPPEDGIPDCEFLILTTQGYSIEPNDRGYGLKAKFIPYNPEWWHLNVGDYQAQYLRRALTGGASFGRVELSYNDGNPVARIAVSWDQEVSTEQDAQYCVGVDIGYNNLYAVAVREIESGDVVDVSVQSGGAFQHTRNRLERRQTRLKQSHKLDRATTARYKRQRYTDDRLHKAASEIVTTASQYEPCVIALEDIGDYRDSERRVLHDWPYSDLLEKIRTKAHEAGIGVVDRETEYTSQTCRKCGYQHPENRDGPHFACLECGYEVNADVNAAMNIATPG